MDEDRRLFGLVVAGVGPVFVAIALVPLRDTVSNVNVALMMVVPVVVSAAIGGRFAGALAAVIATASFDFFHTRPYLSLRITSEDDVETALILLGVGAIVGTVAAQAQRWSGAASEQRDELRSIHRVAELAAGGAAVEAVTDAACAELRSLMGLRACSFDAGTEHGGQPTLDRRGAVVGRTRSYVFARRGLELPPEGVDVDVVAGGRVLGRLVLEPAPGVGVPLHTRVAAVVIADQLGAALAASSR